MTGRPIFRLATIAVTILALGLTGSPGQEAASSKPGESPRTWTAGGGKSVRGVMIGIEGSGVRLKLEDGRVVTPPLSQLSEADQRYVAKRVAAIVTKPLAKASTTLASATSDVNSAWPMRVSAPAADIAISESGNSGGMFRFQTRSFDWASNVDLPAETRRDLVRFFEGTMKLIRLLPGPLGETAAEGGGGRFGVALFDTPDALATASGTTGRESVYDAEAGVLRCLLKAGGVVKSGPELIFDAGFKGEQIRRELVRMSLERTGDGYLPPWAEIGITEYVAGVPQVNGVFFSGRALENFQHARSTQAAAYDALAGIIGLDGKAWGTRAQSRPGAHKPMKQAAVLLVHHLAAEQSSAFEKMLTVAADSGPKWDTYFAKAAIYRKEMEALRKRPDVEFREDGRFRLPAGEKPPELPVAPDNSDPNQLPQRLTEIATGGMSAAELAAAVKGGIETTLEKAPSAAASASAGQARTWTDAQGRTMTASLTGFVTNQAVFSMDGKPIRIPLAKLSPADQEFIALRIPDLVGAAPSAAGGGSVAVIAAKRWPSKLSAPNGLTNADYDQQNSTPGRHLYRTRYFEYTVHAPHPLSPTVMKDIARIFEGTRELLSQSPWGVQAQPDGGAFKAELWETRDQYVRAGGPSNSSGVYLLKEKRFLVPFESLGLKSTGSSYIKTKDYEIKTLVHELTHMMMHDIINSMPIWLSEGTAEYTEAIPLRNYEFHCARIEDGARAVNKRYFELAKHPQFRGIIDFAELIEISHENWNHKIMGTTPKPKTPPKTTGGPGGTVGIDLSGLVTPPGGRFGMIGSRQQSDPLMQAALYQSSLLLTYYFMNLDGDRKGTRLLNLLNAARADKPKWDAYNAAFKQYDREIREFMKRPDVQTLPDGTFKYPSSLTPPKPPEPPVQVGPDGDLGLAHIDLLLDGRSPEQVAGEARAALQEAGFLLE